MLKIVVILFMFNVKWWSCKLFLFMCWCKKFYMYVGVLICVSFAVNNSVVWFEWEVNNDCCFSLLWLVSLVIVMVSILIGLWFFLLLLFLFLSKFWVMFMKSFVVFLCILRICFFVIFFVVFVIFVGCGGLMWINLNLFFCLMFGMVYLECGVYSVILMLVVLVCFVWFEWWMYVSAFFGGSYWITSSTSVMFKFCVVMLVVIKIWNLFFWKLVKMILCWFWLMLLWSVFVFFGIFFCKLS